MDSLQLERLLNHFQQRVSLSWRLNLIDVWDWSWFLFCRRVREVVHEDLQDGFDVHFDLTIGRHVFG
jgi:hypothetical protein